ncbi:ABC-2 family transporter protein [Clostridium homopropionicum DSM 5847]|uniref:ABC-2 family transporter protein n=1 Tax=Clostridium homopropionicum DSM 5847 TaxID=1121318 RepID=A0A0L6Z5G0_9CLOT|nr:ABC transporter permease [Clostridium homopropionicum]KOA18199.1 ABC-2 family transporter protein [Clostridium homopropionicum DSM 5847]SFF71410.1 ABC-2 type transport system permease protein [Clostridium homopropionicum]
MRILNIAYKDIIENLRDKRNMLIMTLFPIILILILGTAFSKVMSDSVDLGEIEVIYTVKGEGNVSKAFDSLKEDLKDYKVSFTYEKDESKALKAIEDSNYSCYIVFDEINKEIKLYKNDRYNLNAGFIEGILNTFVQRYNVISEIAVVNPRIIGDLNTEKNIQYVKVEALDKKEQPRAVDYYGITMTTLIVMYASMTAGFGMSSERTRKTLNRMFISPLKKQEIFTGKVLGFLAVTMIQIAIVLAFGKFIIKVNWGDNILAVAAVLAAEIVMAVSIGIAVSFIAKSEGAMSGILNMIVVVMIFLGGGYVPLEQFNSATLDTIAKLSPIKWVNDAMFNSIYRNDFSKIVPAILINLIIGLILMFISSIAFRKEEV